MIKKLYIEPSSRCNLNCKMCFRNNWFDEKTGLMSEETLNNVYDAFKIKDIETVFFGGMGEPLLHPQIDRMIKNAASAEKRTELITNVTLLNSIMTDRIISAGLDTLWISMDGFSKESYEQIRKGSMYELIMKNISTFNSKRTTTKLGITFVMMQENECELENINSFAHYIGAELINLSHVIPDKPLSKENCLYEKDYPTGKMYRLESINTLKKENYCPFIEDGAVFIRWDGEVSPCMQLLHNSYSYLYKEKRKVYAKTYGNINDNNFLSIYNNTEYIQFRQNVREFQYPCCTICLGCDDRLENRTDCMFNTAPTCGACLWAQGLIRCP